MKYYFFKIGIFGLLIILLASCGRKNIPAASTLDITVSEEDLQAIEEGKEVEEVLAEEVPAPVVAEIVPLAPYLLLSLQKTDCPGICPVFELRLFSDGRALYRGIKDVPMIGKFESRVTDEQLTALISEADRINFFALDNKYPANGAMIRELPTTVTSINQVSKAHSVTNSFDGPKRLQSFEDYLVRFFEGLSWNRVAG